MRKLMNLLFLNLEYKGKRFDPSMQDSFDGIRKLKSQDKKYMKQLRKKYKAKSK